MGAHLVLITCYKPVMAIVQQCCRFVLLETNRMFLSLPGRAAIKRAESHEFFRVLMVLIDLAKPVSKNQEAVLWLGGREYAGASR